MGFRWGTLLLPVVPGLLAGAVAAAPMTIRTERFDGIPYLLDARATVYLDGDIDAPGVTQLGRTLDGLQDLPVTIQFNSAGGELKAALAMGRLIRSHGAATSVGRPGAKRFDTLPGKCLSACAVAYLGGRFRYFTRGSTYGVHRASRSGKRHGDELEVGQKISAMLAGYFREMEADPALLNLIAATAPDKLYALSGSELQSLRIVNDGRLPSSWTIEAVPGGSYLKGMQETVYGRGKAIFSCYDGQLIFFSVYEAGERAGTIAGGKWVHALRVDDDDLPLDKPAQLTAENDYLNASFLLKSADFERILSAKRVGHVMQPVKDSPTFVGYSVDIDKASADRVRHFIGNCLAVKKR